MTFPDEQSSTDVSSQPETTSEKEETFREKGQDVETNAASGLTNDGSGSQKEIMAKPAIPFYTSQFPDGGRDAWLCVAGSAACFFCSFGWVNALGVFQNYYESVALRQYSPSTVGWIVSTEVFLMIFMLPSVGLWYDNFGPRWLLLAGAFLEVFGLMMTSLVNKYYQYFLAQGVCTALGAAMIFGPAMMCNQTWFWKKRGLATGLAAAGSSLGGVIFPIVVGRMIDETSFPWAIRTCAFIILALMNFANFTVKSRLPLNKRKFELRAFVRPFKEVPFLMVVVGLFFTYYSFFMPIAFIVVDTADHGMSLELAQYLVSILNAVSIFGRTLPGFIGDKINRCNTLILFCALTVILILGMWIPAKTNGVYIGFAALFDFSSGAAIGLSPALIAQISPVSEIGTRIGAAFGFASIAALTGTPIGGALIVAAHDRYLYMELFAGVAGIIGILFLIAAIISLAGMTVVKKI